MEKKIVKKKTYTFEIIHYDDGSVAWNRINNGFNLLELLGIANLLSIDLALQVSNEIAPQIDMIKRSVVVNKKDEILKEAKEKFIENISILCDNALLNCTGYVNLSGGDDDFCIEIEARDMKGTPYIIDVYKESEGGWLNNVKIRK